MHRLLHSVRAHSPLWAAAIFCTTLFVMSAGTTIYVDGWLAYWAGGIVHEWGARVPDMWMAGDVHPWVDQQWLGQWITYLVWQATGPLGASLLLVIAPTLLALGMMVRLARRCGARDWPLALSLVVATAGIFPFVSLRPQTLALPLFAAALTIIVQGRERPQWLWVLLPIMLIWANVHGSILMMGPLAALGVAWAIWPTWRTMGRRDRGLVGLLGSLLALSPLFSPLAMDLPGYYLRLLDPNGAPNLAMEWWPLNVAEDRGIGLMVILVGVVLARWRRIPLPLLAVTIILGIGTMFSIRQGIWLALALLVSLPLALTGMGLTRAPAWLGGIRQKFADGRVGLALMVLALLFAMGLALVDADTRNRMPSSAGLEVVARTPGPVLADSALTNWALVQRPDLAGRFDADARLELYDRGRIDSLWRLIQADTRPVKGGVHLSDYSLVLLGDLGRTRREERLKVAKLFAPYAMVIADAPDLTVLRVTPAARQLPRGPVF